MAIVRRLVNPTEIEIEEVVAVLKSAFIPGSPDFFGLVFSGPNKETGYALQRAVVRAGLIGGEVWVAGFEPKDICAVAVWFGPGNDFLATEEQRAAGWNEAEAKFTPELRKWWTDYFIPRASSWSRAILGEGTMLSSWQLELLGTSPEHQKKGLAAALIKAIELKAEANGERMCLETSNVVNVPFYKKLGYTVRGTLSIDTAGGEITITSLTKF